MKNNNEHTNAFLIHISAFAGFIFPFGNIVSPLIAWQTLKDRSAFLDEQGKEAVNFNISYTLYILVLSILFLPFAIGSFFSSHKRHINWNNFNINFDISTDNLFGLLSFGTLSSIIYLASIILVIIAALKAKDGNNYKYPFTIKFIK